MYVGLENEEELTRMRGGLQFVAAIAVFAGMVVPFAGAGGWKQQTTTTEQAKKPAAKSKSSSAGTTSSSKSGVSSKRAASKNGAAAKSHAATGSHAPTAQTIRLTSAFKASEQLRPMAQQLAATRSAAAYGGVEGYARAHPGEGAAAAYLALGHAYMLDHRYGEAAETFRRAGASGTALDDYADYLAAQAAVQAGKGADAYGM